MTVSSDDLVKVMGRALGELYLGGDSSAKWAGALDGLTAAQAQQRARDLPHSVAELVAHVQFWQERVLLVVQGARPEPVQTAAEGWPACEDWEALKAAFQRDSERLRRHCQDPALLATPNFRGEPKATDLIHFAAHSVHHLGQVIAARQALGLWPPPGGGDTW